MAQNGYCNETGKGAVARFKVTVLGGAGKRLVEIALFNKNCKQSRSRDVARSQTAGDLRRRYRWDARTRSGFSVSSCRTRNGPGPLV